MKKLLIVCSLMACVCMCYSQCFTTEFVFEDKDGNLDTLIVGVSENVAECELQTDSWSEEDALSALTRGRHWAWFGYLDGYGRPCTPHRIHITTPTKGSVENGRIHMWYPKDRLPVTVRWNKDDFDDSSRNYSIFSDAATWFDVSCGGEGYKIFAISRSSMALTLEQECDFNYVLLQDTIIAANELGFAFCDKDVWFSPVENVRSEQASHPRLILENGMLYIVQDDKRYSILGSHIE